MRTINKNVFERVLLWAGRSDLLNLLTFANASERYVRRPTDGDLFGPFASGIPAKIPISGHPYLHSLGAVSAFTDLGQQYSQTHILSLSSLGNGIALAGTYPHGKILRSVDYGATWADLGQQYSQTYVYELCYLGNGIALAGTAPNGKILRSVDYGATWADLGQQYSQTEIRALRSLGNGIALAGTAPNGKILRSVDYGATWADLGQQYSQTYIFSLSSLGNGIALAGTYLDGKILRSVDYGATWADLGRQYSQTHILSLSSLGNGIALAGTYPHGKILRSVDYGATWADLGQQYSQTYVYELCYLGNGIALAGTGVDGKILRTTNSSFSQVKDQSYIASALLPNSLRDKCRFSFYTPYSDTQMASGEKCYLARYDDSGANSVGLYLYQTDKKVHLEINGVDSILSGALTWSAGDPQKSVLIDRLAGTLTTAGFTTGNSTETGAVWSQPNGLLRLGMDGSELNHLRGFVRIDAS